MRHWTVLAIAMIASLCWTTRLQAQEYPPVTIPGTEVRTIETTIVNSDDYRFYVALPAGYAESSEVYPVLYVLDASNQFAMVVQTYRLLRAFNEIPPLLLVGIAHEKNFTHDRARDFTPTVLSQEEIRERYGAVMARYTPNSGQAPRFLEFFERDIIPFVEDNYRADSSDRGIFGHSYGGLFVAYALFNAPDLFRRYLIASSASWWDDDVVLMDEAKLAEDRADLDAKVLATVGGDEGELIVGAWARLRTRLSSRDYPEFQFKALMFPGETHVSVPPRTYSTALRFLYGRD